MQKIVLLLKKNFESNEEIYHCPKCWGKVNKWYWECTNCWAELEWSEKDISSAKNHALRKAKKNMNNSFITTLIIILINLLSLTVITTKKYILLYWNDEYATKLCFLRIIIFAVIAICMKLLKNRMAFIFMFLVSLVSLISFFDNFVVLSGMFNSNSRILIIYILIIALLIFIFYKWMRGSFVYRNIKWKKKLSVDERILLIIWIIAIVFMIMWFVADN